MFAKKTFTLNIIVLFTLFLSGPINAIDCKRAAAKDEKIICKSKSLKNYDAALTKIYDTISNSLNNDDKKKLKDSQQDWLKERSKINDEDKLSDSYMNRIRALCNTYTNVCKSLAQNVLSKWNNDGKKISDVDSIIISSYIKCNLSQYIDDKKALNEIEEDINSHDHMVSLDNVDLHKLNKDFTLVTVPIFMAAYQGQSISFLYDTQQKDFKVVQFPQFEEKLIYPFTHSSYADWVDGGLMIHNRSQGYLYECGTTQYYKFENNTFTFIKQERIDCSEKELEDIQNGKLTPENLKIETDYKAEKDPPTNSESPSQNSSLTPVNPNEKQMSNFLTENSNLQFTFLFPVIEGKVQLKITIPKDFKALESDPRSELLEFIPNKDQDPYKWSEIITLTKILGTGITAPDYIEKLDATFLNSATSAKVIEKDKHVYDDYQDASSIIQYQSNGRDEIVIFYSVSGPMDISNVQYALPLSSPDKIDESVKKLKAFIKSNVEIIKQQADSNQQSQIQ